MVNPGFSSLIETFFSENHSDFILPNYIDRSNRMLFEFLERIAAVLSRQIRTVYFHNFSRFDGILLMKYYAMLLMGTSTPLNLLLGIITLRVNSVSWEESSLPYKRFIFTSS